MLESEYQAHIIKRLNNTFPGCLVLKNDSGYMQGIPDLSIFWGPKWAMLEVKPSVNAKEQPNQSYYVDLLDRMSFAAFIHPDNEDVIFDALQHAFES